MDLWGGFIPQFMGIRGDQNDSDKIYSLIQKYSCPLYPNYLDQPII